MRSGLKQVVDSSSLGQKFRVGENVEVDAGVSETVEDLAQALCSTTWHCALLDDDLVSGGDFGDVAGCRFDVGEIRC